MFTSPGDEASALADNIKKVIEFRSSNSSRSRQKAIGLSEIGDPCARKLAYKILDWPQTNGSTDPWASIQGTAIHSWLADAFERFNDKDDPRFMIEFRVKVSEDLGGTCDLYDKVDGVVIDHKCMGTTSMKSRKRDGMTAQQRVQVNAYGYGLEQMVMRSRALPLLAIHWAVALTDFTPSSSLMIDRLPSMLLSALMESKFWCGS